MFAPHARIHESLAARSCETAAAGAARTGGGLVEGSPRNGLLRAWKLGVSCTVGIPMPYVTVANLLPRRVRRRRAPRRPRSPAALPAHPLTALPSLAASASPCPDCTRPPPSAPSAAAALPAPMPPPRRLTRLHRLSTGYGFECVPQVPLRVRGPRCQEHRQRPSCNANSPPQLFRWTNWSEVHPGHNAHPAGAR